MTKAINRFDAALNGLLYKWRLFDSQGRGRQARYEAQLAINKCKSVLSGRSRDEELRNKALIYGVFFRGLQDYNDLAILTHLPNWHKQEQLVERIWRLVCDCEDRTNFVSPYIKGRVMEIVRNDISRLIEAFEGMPQVYCSIGYDVKNVLCSICKKDFRACGHTRGWIYAGSICYAISMEEKVVREVSFTHTPKDKRCRGWPWNATEEMKVNVMAASYFRLDDFMKERDKIKEEWIVW
ncbi:MAG: hypothetical protein ACXV3D_03405 [Halobacteriota archaeon]